MSKKPLSNDTSSPAEFETVSNASAAAEPARALEKALGAQIRKLRRERDLSVVDLATSAGISVGMMSKIENGQISPSLSTIKSVASVLHASFSTLFSAFEDKRACSFVARGHGTVIQRRGTKAGHGYALLGALLAADVTVEPYLITLDEDAVSYTGFRHAGTEFIYMLTGELVYRHGDQLYPLAAGDALLFDAAGLHGPEHLVSWPITYLSIIVYPRTASSEASRRA